jgi:hypothetical protein
VAISLYLVDWPFAIFKVLMGEHRIRSSTAKIPSSLTACAAGCAPQGGVGCSSPVATP